MSVSACECNQLLPERLFHQRSICGYKGPLDLLITADVITRIELVHLHP